MEKASLYRFSETNLCQLPIVTFKSNKDNFAKLLDEFKAQLLPEPSQPSRDCLRSLAFPEMDNRSNDIDAAAEGTCEWLFHHEMYRSWVVCNRSLLWIKGNPGSGKSTLMRYALDNVMVASSKTDALVLSFFFHGRGVELQRTPLGLFRSLLHQLLGRVPDEMPGLVAAFGNHRRDFEGKWEWRLSELQQYFKSSLINVLDKRPIWLFIDALDECGKENAVGLVAELKSLIQGLPTTRFPFHVCFSCRHYPFYTWTANLKSALNGKTDMLLQHSSRKSCLHSPYKRHL